MPQEIKLFGSDKRMVLSNGEAIRAPIYGPISGEIIPAAMTGSGTTHLFTAPGHGLPNHTPVRFLSDYASGARGRAFLVINATEDTFRLADPTTPYNPHSMTSSESNTRVMKLGWRYMRIGIRMAFDRLVNETITGSLFSVGVCRGNEFGYGSPNTVEAIGFRWGGNNTPNIIYRPGPPAYMEFDPAIAATVRKVGSSLVFSTSGVSTGSVLKFSPDPNIRHGLILDISTGNGTSCFAGGLSTSTEVESDLTDAQFTQMMELPQDYTTVQIAAIKPGYMKYGALSVANYFVSSYWDHIYVYWDKTDPKLTFDIKHRMFA